MGTKPIDVDAYLADGCGRCDLWATPECKVNGWRDELAALRRIALDVGLVETIKWGVPCYTDGGRNILILSAYKDHATINLFKGVLLSDPERILQSPGPSSQSARYLAFTSVDDIEASAEVIRAYMEEAVANERAGREVEFKKSPEPMPAELTERLQADPALKEAFDALTPGRQRSYILHIGSAKQAATRHRRVERCVDKIHSGKGFNER